MRSFENGTLKMDGDPVFGMPPHNVMGVPMVNAPAPHLLSQLKADRMFLLGDPRTNQNPAFLALGILFYRWHNYQVSHLVFCHLQDLDSQIFSFINFLGTKIVSAFPAYSSIQKNNVFCVV
jgi:dual oxidase